MTVFIPCLFHFICIMCKKEIVSLLDNLSGSPFFFFEMSKRENVNNEYFHLNSNKLPSMDEYIQYTK